MDSRTTQMPPGRMATRLAAIVGVLLFASFAFSATATAGMPQSDMTVIEKDRIRIQAHLQNVEQELRSRDVTHLSPELQAERERNLDRLHEYWTAGEFPHNTHVPWRQPVFIDRDGRACAVGYLMIESGWDEEARAISERENLAYLPNMKSPEVGEWVAQSGLTAEEAAWIQPTYSDCASGCSCDAEPVCGKDGKTYVNLCFAQNCGGVEEYREGCCVPDDDIQSVYSQGYGTFPQNCPSDPNQMSAEYCPDGSADAGGDAGADVWQQADDPVDDQESACSSANGGPVNVAVFMLVLLGWVGLRRRDA